MRELRLARGISYEWQNRLRRMMIGCVLTGLCTIVSAGVAEAKVQESVVATSSREISYEITLKDWLADTKEVASSPAGWKPTDWKRALMVGGAGLFIHEKDDKIRRHFQGARNGGSDDLAKVGNALPMVGAAYFATNYFYGNERQRKTAVNALESVGSALLITETLGVLAERERPSGSGQSFPSTHTAAAFAMATVVAEEYQEDKLVPALAYGLAALTAYGRMNDDEHWASDVFVGALIGHYTARRIMDLNENTGYTVQPYVVSDKAGVMVTREF